MQALLVVLGENTTPQGKSSSSGPGRAIKSGKSIALQLIWGI